ncbi:MAG: N,N-dimethylformamidase beta subunit family domain-containing protein [Chloroflexota bacterium]
MGIRFRSLRLIALLAFLLTLAAQPLHAARAHPAREENPIVRENELPGTGSWQLTMPSRGFAIQGYASAVSVSPGHDISFSVSTKSPEFNLDVYRMGWYGGKGASLKLSATSIAGHFYPTPPPAPKTGLIDCGWPASITVYVPPAWVSGMYLVKITASSGFQGYIPFTVLDNRRSAYLFIHGVNTDEAYNVWGGKSLYQDTAYPGNAGFDHRALMVSFDRPFHQVYGAGQLFFWEYDMIRWLERRGYDVSYATDVDVHRRLSTLGRHKAVLIVGHDEYWSKSMRDHYQRAVRSGVNLGVFAGNTGYWSIRYLPQGRRADRIIVCYKYPSTFDPYVDTNPKRVTSQWRAPPLNRPESILLGAMWHGEESHLSPQAWVVTKPGSWIFRGTRLAHGGSVSGVVGYEYDQVVPKFPHPRRLVVLTNSPVIANDGSHDVSNSTIYVAKSGATVFNAGTIQWSWGLDPFAVPDQGTPAPPAGSAPSHALQIVTANILRRIG